MIKYTKANFSDLSGILQLQKINLPHALSEEEIKSQGFVTLVHTLPLLDKLNQIEQHLIAKENGKVIAYVLAMTAQSRNTIPALQPLFAHFDQLHYKERPIASYQYLLIGQVCVAKAFRGQGVFDQSYAVYRQFYSNKYDFALTSIDANNLRSLSAHRRIGFQQIHQFKETDKKTWCIVLWDWQ